MSLVCVAHCRDGCGGVSPKDNTQVSSRCLGAEPDGTQDDLSALETTSTRSTHFHRAPSFALFAPALCCGRKRQSRGRIPGQRRLLSAPTTMEVLAINWSLL